MVQHLTDQQGRCIGKVIDQGDDQLLTDEQGRPLAKYLTRQNITTGPNGNYIGAGNVMLTQLPRG